MCRIIHIYVYLACIACCVACSESLHHVRVFAIFVQHECKNFLGERRYCFGSFGNVFAICGNIVRNFVENWLDIF